MSAHTPPAVRRRRFRLRPTTRIRWAAVGATAAVLLGSGGLMTASATIGSGPKAVFVAVRPCTLVDTRPGASRVGPRSTPLKPTEVVTQQVTGTNGKCLIPAGATAVAINVTVSSGSTTGRLTLFPAHLARPATADLNWSANQRVQNSVDVGLSPAGALKFYNALGTVHVRADITGYFMNHHHDDRYLTKAQTKSAINSAVAANAHEVVAVESTLGVFTPPTSQATLSASTFTTTKAGRLHVSMHAIGGLKCATSVAYDVWLVVDGAYIPASRQRPLTIAAAAGFDAAGFPAHALEGVTAAAVAAGLHTVTVEAACTTGAMSASRSNAVFSGVVSVLP